MQTQPSQRRILKVKLARALPQEISDALSSIDNANKLDYICKKYGLDLQKTKQVSMEIGEYALGLTPFGALPQNLKTRTGLPLDLGQKLINEIMQDVYGSIKIPLQKYLASVKIPSVNQPTQQTVLKTDATVKLEIAAPHNIELPGSVPVAPQPRPSFTSEKSAFVAQKPQTPVAKQIRTLETDIAKSAAQDAEKKPISIPKQTTIREVPQVNPSTGEYRKDPYREQI